MPSLLAPYAWLPEGWQSNVQIDIDAEGVIQSVTPNSQEQNAERLSGIVLPGLPNLHSHAFQRGLAGLSERRGSASDTFWTWRQTMYRFLDCLTPDQLEGLATQTYIEMLKAGYTSVAEFHYLHRDPQGRLYPDAAELSERMIAAAKTAGIRLTLLPVLYAYSGFNQQPAALEQRRFLNSVDTFLTLWQRLHEDQHAAPFRLGLAFHSLRAVSQEMVSDILEAVDQIDPKAPIHLHIAEQQQEVEACVAWSGLRPVEWLLHHLPVSSRWCLVHATHVTPAEVAQLVKSQVTVGLCPTTEANLGDGIFPAVQFLEQGGSFGIGSDSQISISPMEELRWLEYGQRLLHQQRNLLCTATVSTGECLYHQALSGGARALGQPVGALAPGCSADLLVLDPQHPALVGRAPTYWLDSMIFNGNSAMIQDVMVAGAWVIRAGHHEQEASALNDYQTTVAAILKQTY